MNSDDTTGTISQELYSLILKLNVLFQIARIPSPSSDSRLVTERIALQRENTRLKNPHNAVRMATVTMSARLEPSLIGQAYRIRNM